MKMVIACGLLSAVAIGSGVASAQERVANFGLRDQNNRYKEVNFPSDRPVMLIFGDRNGAGQIGGWSQPVYTEYSSRIYLFGVASLSGVPSYARGLVRRLIKQQTSFPVLLDWGGLVAGRLGYEKNRAFVVLVRQDGSIVSKRSGPATSDAVRDLKAEIDKLLSVLP